jgi:putative colanic acid biosynthesis UDP-glucose lipid carrier transferase
MTTAPPLATFTWSEAQAGARAVSPSSDPVKLLSGGVAAADAAVVLLSCAGAYLLRHGAAVPPLEITATALLAALLTINAMRLAGAYAWHAAASPVAQASRVAQGWSAVFVVLVILGYLTKTSDDFSRVWAITWYGAALAGLALVRFGAAAKMRRWRGRGRLVRTVAIVDLAGTGEELARRMLRSAAGEMRLVGVFSPQPAAERRNGVADLVALARLFRIDEVIVAVSGQDDAVADAVVRKLGTIPTNVRLCPEVPSMAIAPREATLLFGQPALTVYHRPLPGWSRVAKRVEDVVLSAVALVLLAPLLAAVALLVKLDSPGPVLFQQKRLGFNNNVITVLKFRTMRHRPEPEGDVPQAQRRDPRVTRVGAILRRTSLDELPQLLNVLRGEMSLVGPRPHALAHNDQYAALIDEYLGRHRVQPGITGWAQVNGLRGETATLDKMQRRVEHDLVYIDGWSLLLDLKILALTVITSVFDRNAY